MFLFERAAELKAKTELCTKLGSQYVGRTTVWVAYTSYEIATELIKAAMQPPQEEKSMTRRYKRLPQNGTDLSQSAPQHATPNPAQAPTTPQFAQSTATATTTTTTKIPTSQEELTQNVDLQEQFRLFQLMLAQQGGASAGGFPFAQPAAQPQQQQQQPQPQQQQQRAAVIPPAPYLAGFIGPDGAIVAEVQVVKQSYASQQPPKPAAAANKPNNNTRTQSGLDLSELKNRPLRKVGADDNNNNPKPAPAPSAGPGGFDLNELKNRPLRKVDPNDKNNNPPLATNSAPGGFSLAELKNRPLRKVEVNADKNKQDDGFKPIPLPELRKTGSQFAAPAPPPPQPELVAGKRIVSSNIPGEEHMSFSERIKIASKMSLKQTAGQRSPGGTPRRDPRKNLEDAPFVLALRDKFKNARGGSLEPHDNETDGEEWR